MNLPDPAAAHTPSTDRALFWGRVYAFAFAAMYFLLVLLGIAMVFTTDAFRSKGGSMPLGIQGIIVAVVSVPLGAVSLVAALAPRKKWGWTINIVIQAIGTTGCMCLPAALPLFIRWMKPDVKAAFGA